MTVDHKRDDQVDERAAELQVEQDDDLGDSKTARTAADQMLEESRERTDQAEDLDPADDDVIRRTSEETAVEP